MMTDAILEPFPLDNELLRTLIHDCLVQDAVMIFLASEMEPLITMSGSTMGYPTGIAPVEAVGFEAALDALLLARGRTGAFTMLNHTFDFNIVSRTVTLSKRDATWDDVVPKLLTQLTEMKGREMHVPRRFQSLPIQPVQVKGWSGNGGVLLDTVLTGNDLDALASGRPGSFPLGHDGHRFRVEIDRDSNGSPDGILFRRLSVEAPGSDGARP